MNLSKNFTLDELIESNTATRKGIKNIPSPQVVQNLTELADTLEEIRALINAPISISSGYRCLELNRIVGGSSNSAHLSGYAADFTARKYGNPHKIVKAIMDSDIEFDQLIEEGTWVHISVDKRMRRQVLSATFGRKTTYSEFKP